MASLLTFDDVMEMTSSEVISKTFDFADDAPGETLSNIGSGSDITAVDETGSDVSSTIISSKTRTGLTLSCKISSLTAGKDYLVKFHGKSGTSTQEFDKFLLVKCRTRGIYL